jgi:hypothetical protein
MKKILVSVGILSIMLGGVFSYSHVSAQTPVDPGTTTPVDPGTPGQATFDFSIANPVRGFSTIDGIIAALLEIVQIIATPIVAVMLIYAGFLFATARGDTAKLKKAKETLLYVVIGAAIILGAEVIARAIEGTVESLT